MKTGTALSLKKILEYAIRESDNVAIRILRENFKVSGFMKYAKETMNIEHPEYIRNVTGGLITAREAGHYMEAIYEFIRTNPYGRVLKEHLANTTSTPLIISQYPIYHKYGWWERSFHDMAIIEGKKRDYLLCICTSHDEGDYKSFRKISQAIEKISQ